MAKGRIFALGDCVKVLDAMRFTKDIYPAEAMVEVVVANLRALKRCKEVKRVGVATEKVCIGIAVLLVVVG